MSLSIHIGAHKTASTSLERSIWTVEEQLIEQGYMFLTPQILRHEPFDLNWALGNPGRDPQRHQKLRKLMRELMVENDHMLISEEQILGGLGSAHFLGDDGKIYLHAEKRLRILLQLLGTTDATVFLSVRSPASFLTSAYGEHFAHGYYPDHLSPLTAEIFLHDYDPRSLCWSQLVGRLLEKNPISLVCWRFEDFGMVQKQIFRRLFGDDLANQIKDIPFQRAGMSQAAYDMVLSGSKGLTRLQRNQLRKQAMAEHPKGPNEPPLRIFDDETVQKCETLYAQDCKKIAAMPGVEFLWPDQAV